MEASPFRVLLLKISEELSEREWQSCALTYKIPTRQRESFKQAIDFFEWLCDQQAISPENLNLLKQMLKSTKRDDLVNLINEFESKC
jgi:hypothetical protein